MKINRKTFTNILFLFTFLIVLPNFFLLKEVRAVEPSFSFFPKGGTVMNKEEGFVVDILIDTAGEEIVSAKFTVTFDPEVLQLKKAERNNSLFAQFPEDESSIDNGNGVVMLSGFTQSGTEALYATGEKPDVLARLTFEVLEEGETVLDWEYGEDAIFNTGMYKDGSPPQSILVGKPDSGTFIIGGVITDPSIPTTGLSLDRYVLVTGIVLTLFGAFMVFTRPGGFRRKTGTVVIYDE